MRSRSRRLAETVRRGSQGEYEYYVVAAEHRRVHPIGHRAFVGKLAMVRVTLPAAEPRLVRTAIGTIDPSDHLVTSVRAANERFRAELGYELTRVDLIAPARRGRLFGAISVLLGYRAAESAPSCYVLEAGLATGEPRQLYLSKTLDAGIEQLTGYSPTPFASADNLYTARLLVESDHPTQLRVDVQETRSGAPNRTYLELTATFERQRAVPSTAAPGRLLARATAIVIARMIRGVPVRSPGALLPPRWRA